MGQQITKSPFNEDFYSLLKTYISEDYRRSGKTFNMLRILVEISIETQRPVAFIDHIMVQQGMQRGMDHLNYILKEVVGYYENHGVKLAVFKSTERGFGVSIISGHREYDHIRLENVAIEEDPEPINEEEFLLLLMN